MYPQFNEDYYNALALMPPSPGSCGPRRAALRGPPVGPASRVHWRAARLIDRFWRADPARERRTGGTGLGLAIALEDAHLHGGRIDVWAAPGEGACFRLTIPRAGALDPVSPVGLPPMVEVSDA